MPTLMWRCRSISMRNEEEPPSSLHHSVRFVPYTLLLPIDICCRSNRVCDQSKIRSKTLLRAQLSCCPIRSLASNVFQAILKCRRNEIKSRLDWKNWLWCAVDGNLSLWNRRTWNEMNRELSIVNVLLILDWLFGSDFTFSIHFKVLENIRKIKCYFSFEMKCANFAMNCWGNVKDVFNVNWYELSV